MKQEWGIGDRKFQNDFRRRRMLFDCLVVGVTLYGVELFDWKERIQQKYITWCLGLEICTPGCMIEETKRDKIRIRVGQRAMQYKERIGNTKSVSILKECLREKEREATKTRNAQERREYLMRNGYSQAGIDQLRERNVNVVKNTKRKG